MEEVRQMDLVRKIPLTELKPFKDNPFRVTEDGSMQMTAQSISVYGILTPLVARPLKEGGYEVISGQRRILAAKAAGFEEVPVIVREMDDDTARIFVVDSNMQRENILPSERAFAYKMKAEAMKHQGKRTDLTSCQVGTKSRTDEQIAEGSSESARNVQRFIRLTNLTPELLEMLDRKKISFNPAVELSYLSREEQDRLIEAMDLTQAAPSLSQAQRMKKLSREGGCSLDDMRDILGEIKKGEVERVSFKSEQLRKYFPRSYTPRQMSDVIIRLLEIWYRKRQKAAQGQ